MFESSCCRGRGEPALRRGPVKLNPLIERATQKTDRTQRCGCRKLRTANQTCASLAHVTQPSPGFDEGFAKGIGFLVRQ
jgi:hypothetical protein